MVTPAAFAVVQVRLTATVPGHDAGLGAAVNEAMVGEADALVVVAVVVVDG